MVGRNVQEKIALYCGDGIIPDLETEDFNSEEKVDVEMHRIISGAMKNAFPITNSILSQRDWETLINDLYKEHNSKTYHFYTLPYDFYLFAFEKGYDQILNLPFLNDLMYFEWIMLDTKVSISIKNNPFRLKGNVMNDMLCLNPSHHLIQIDYPVHKYDPIESVRYQDTYFVLTYRHPVTGDAFAVELTDVEAFIFERLDSTIMTVAEILEDYVQLYPEIDMIELKNDMKMFIQSMIEARAIFGYHDYER